MFTDSLFLPHDSLSAKSVSYGIETAKDKYGEYPLWAPWMFAGLPSTHSMQNISEYYFPHHIISFIKLIGLPWFWNYLLHFLFCGLGMYLLLRKIKLDFMSSIFGGVAIVSFPWMVVNIAHGHGLDQGQIIIFIAAPRYYAVEFIIVETLQCHRVDFHF